MKHSEKTYQITQHQLDMIGHYKRMFEDNAELINGLCNTNNQEDKMITIGFELGKMHSHLRDCFIGMMELESEIKMSE